MTFVQVIKYMKVNIFFKNHTENKAEKLVPVPFFFKNTLHKTKASCLQLIFNIF